MYNQSLEYFSKDEIITFIKDNFNKKEIKFMETSLSRKKLKQLQSECDKYNLAIPYIEEELKKCKFDFTKEIARAKLISYRRERDRIQCEIDKFEL